jgi:hypothetical protein
MMTCTCNAGYTGQDGSSCAACVAGKFKIAIGPSVCSNCESGKYSASVGADSITACEACPTNSIAPEASNELTDCLCNAGYTVTAVGLCTACKAGKFKAQTGSAECSECIAGTFSTTLAATSIDTCQPCDAGQYSTTVGADSITACQACPLNSNAPAASNELIDCLCDAGFSGPNGGPCTQCDVGKYKASAGPDDCTDCESGKYSSVLGAIAVDTCSACPENSDAPAGSSAM